MTDQNVVVQAVTHIEAAVVCVKAQVGIDEHRGGDNRHDQQQPSRTSPHDRSLAITGCSGIRPRMAARVRKSAYGLRR
ncbi:hypothetical protein Mro03_24750 [Microbispora rosea subsp. rosea]|nr:hypothetical protein Mro03_24750 [Microbispora rosea subsp. rosea]